jgi:hypothetical protein
MAGLDAAIHSATSTMDGVRTLPLLTKGGHDKLSWM